MICKCINLCYLLEKIKLIKNKWTKQEKKFYWKNFNVHSKVMNHSIRTEKKKTVSDKILIKVYNHFFNWSSTLLIICSISLIISNLLAKQLKIKKNQTDKIKS